MGEKEKRKAREEKDKKILNVLTGISEIKSRHWIDRTGESQQEDKASETKVGEQMDS